MGVYVQMYFNVIYLGNPLLQLLYNGGFLQPLFKENKMKPLINISLPQILL